MTTLEKESLQYTFMIVNNRYWFTNRNFEGEDAAPSPPHLWDPPTHHWQLACTLELIQWSLCNHQRNETVYFLWEEEKYCYSRHNDGPPPVLLKRGQAWLKKKDWNRLWFGAENQLRVYERKDSFPFVLNEDNRCESRHFIIRQIFRFNPRRQ